MTAVTTESELGCNPTAKVQLFLETTKLFNCY